MRLVRPVTIDDAALNSSSVAETEAAWSAATTYGAGAVVRRTIANVHQKFTSAQAANLNHPPENDDGTWWEPNGPTNRWAMFDQGVSTQTLDADSIEVELEVPDRVDTLALLNVAGLTARVTMTDASDGVVFDEEYSLVSDSGIIDWYAYFFEPIVRKRDLIVTMMPPYAGALIEVAIEEAGADVACGVLIMGLSRNLGGTQYGASIGITDFSVKSQDEFGDFFVLERAYAKRGNFTLNVPNGFVDELQNLLADYRATPVLWIGSDRFTSTALYAYYREFAVEIAYVDYSLCSLELEGLT